MWSPSTALSTPSKRRCCLTCLVFNILPSGIEHWWANNKSITINCLNTLILLLITSFSQSQWKTLVLSIHLSQAFYLISVAKFVHHLARTKKLHSFSSASLFLFNVSLLCFCATISPRTVRTNSLPDLILISCFLPSGSILQRVKKQQQQQ